MTAVNEVLTGYGSRQGPSIQGVVRIGLLILVCALVIGPLFVLLVTSLTAFTEYQARVPSGC